MAGASTNAAPTLDYAGADPSVEKRAVPVEGFKGTPEEIEAQWFEHAYKGRGDSMLQLTWRAIVMGSVLGCLLALTNLYIGLKAGWAFGVAITACIMSYAIWTSFFKIGLVRTPMTILENNCMQSTASSAGYSTGGTLVSAFSAYMLLNNTLLPWPQLLAWVFFLAVLGVTMAIPMKRQMINVEQLPFPSGIAAAETLRALYATGASGQRSAAALAVSGVLAGVVAFWKDGMSLVAKVGTWLGRPIEWVNNYGFNTLSENLTAKLIGAAWIGRTVTLTLDPIFIAAGAITGLRVCTSMMVGSVLCWCVFVPYYQANGTIQGEGFKNIVQWTLWGGTSCMVTSGLLTFFLQWKAAVRAFSGLASYFGGKRTASPLDAIETPGSWFIIGQVTALIGISYLAHSTFNMPYWQSVIAVLLSFALCLVACRVTGETDTTPVGAMGKITQLTYGVLSPGNININLMAANITAGAAGSASDLLTDLKSGYLLGAHPRKQFIAQFAGIFAGTFMSVVGFQLLVPDASHLGTAQFPAPAAQTWRGVAEALGHGLSNMEPLKIYLIIIGGLIGIILPLLSMMFPKYQNYIPSAAGLGLAWTFNFDNGFNFFLGAVIGYLFTKLNQRKSEEYTFPVASGIIAGGGLMGAILVAVENAPEIIEQLMHRK